MLDTLLSTVVASTLFITSSTLSAPHAAPKVGLTHVLPQNNVVSYTAQDKDSLESISQKYYGKTDFWTNIWNDNPTISDPENVSKDTVLVIRADVPAKANDLSDVLKSRQEKSEEEKNQEYLKSIGYVTDDTATPTPTAQPTQAAPVAPAPAAAGGISEEAITYLGNCEAGMNPARNSGNGYYGAFQFSYGTWKSMNTGYERADLAPIEVQKAAVRQLLQRSSIYNQFPACASKMRNAGLI